MHGKTVLITGGGRGIGAAAAEHLARLGARVVIASRTTTELDAVCARIAAAGSAPARAVVADMGDPASIDALFETVAAEVGPVDVLITCAAVLEPVPFAEVSAESFARVMDVNVRGVFLCCQRAFAQMRGRGGAIVNVSSLGAIRATEKFPGMSTYVASKAAVIGLTECLAVEGRPLGIRVNCIAPGAVDTVMLRSAAPSLRTETLPADLAPTIAYLANDAQSGKVSGSVIEIFSNA